MMMHNSVLSFSGISEIISVQPPSITEERVLTRKPKDLSTQKKKKSNPYFLFCQLRRPDLQASHPEMPSREVTKLLAEEWHSLTEDDKARYFDMYKKSKNESAPSQNASLSNGRGQIMLEIPGTNGNRILIPAFIAE